MSADRAARDGQAAAVRNILADLHHKRPTIIGTSAGPTPPPPHSGSTCVGGSPNSSPAATTFTPYPPENAADGWLCTGRWPAATPTTLRWGLPAGHAALITHAENADG